MKEIVCSNCGDPIPTLENLLYQIDRQSIGFLSGCPLCREEKLKEEIDELVNMLEELRKLQEHDDMFSPEELTRIDALIKKHKGRGIEK